MAECNPQILESQCVEIRRNILETAHRTTAGAHLGSSLSLVEILVTLYDKVSIDIQENRDRIILSKGHGALAQYCVLKQKGVLSEEDLSTFEQNGSVLFAHAKRDITKGLEFSGGSLSLGVSFAIGVALACKEKQLNNRIYVIIGDGECNEGLVWESIMSAAHFKLNNITFIIDHNKLQSDGLVSEVMSLDSLAAKMNAFGCRTLEVDGHSIEQLSNAIDTYDDKPIAIIANTIKGKGVSFMENNAQWHYASMSENQFKQAIEEINRE